MMQKENIFYTTLLLSAVAGYCDTVTFLTADSIFSAHVTGNFIVFAYQVINGSDSRTWIRLLTFPVFIFSVITGRYIAGKSPGGFILLFWEGLLLCFAGFISFAFLHKQSSHFEWQIYFVAMLVVFAMGLQNSFGKLFSKEIFGPTTMMTGNVTQASLDIGNLLTTKFKDTVSWIDLKKQFVNIGGFLGGCFLGAILSKNFGLPVVIVPGLAIVACYFHQRKYIEYRHKK